MIEYTEQAQVVDSLRYCANTILCDKEQCPYIRSGNSYNSGKCFLNLMQAAADMIESKHRQIEELRQEIAEKDKEIEDLKREIMTYPDEEIEREERCGL